MNSSLNNILIFFCVFHLTTALNTTTSKSTTTTTTKILTTTRNPNVDYINQIEYGGKIPSEDQLDLWFTYSTNSTRFCEVTLKRLSENNKIYGYIKLSCPSGKNKTKSLTLPKTLAPISINKTKDYLLEVRLIDNSSVTAYRYWNVSVEAGRQGFQTIGGIVYDANKKEFIMRGVNNPHAWYDSYNRWYAYKALYHIAASKSNTVRIVWEKNSVLNVTDLDKVIGEAINQKLVPMVELHDVTGSSNATRLNEMAQWFADNIWLFIKYRKYIMINIANEWSPWGTKETFWRDSYNTAISIIRNAGYSGCIVVDAPGYAQNPNGPKLYGQDMLNKDQFFNILFSVHMYSAWATQYASYNITFELQEFKNRKIPVIIGEFANGNPTNINGVCKNLKIDALKIMSECLKHGFGYLGWSWAGNGNGECGSLSAMDIVARNDWNTHSNLTTWGNVLINSNGIGIRDTSKIASIF
jgi:mannan endo-1,4-beta-mannosidase